MMAPKASNKMGTIDRLVPCEYLDDVVGPFFIRSFPVTPSLVRDAPQGVGRSP